MQVQPGTPGKISLSWFKRNLEIRNPDTLVHSETLQALRGGGCRIQREGKNGKPGEVGFLCQGRSGHCTTQTGCFCWLQEEEYMCRSALQKSSLTEVEKVNGCESPIQRMVVVIQETRDMRKASWMEDIMVVRGPGALVLLCGKRESITAWKFLLSLWSGRRTA